MAAAPSSDKRGVYNDAKLGAVIPNRYRSQGDGSFAVAMDFNAGSPQLAKDSGGVHKYLGQPARDGTAIADTDPKWQIRKLVYSGADFVGILWADGDAEYDNVWANRESLAYSYLV